MNKNEFWNYVTKDYKRYGFNLRACCFTIFLRALLGVFGLKPRFAFVFWFRLAQTKSLFSFLGKILYWRLSLKYGLQIPVETKIGYGLYLSHGIGVIVNKNTRIGNNCSIAQFVTIGNKNGHSPKICDNVVIGPNVIIIGNVVVGNNAVIGAGSIVVKDIPDNAVVAGNPAKLIRYKDTISFIDNLAK